MVRRKARPLAIVLGCVALAACVVDVSFDMDQKGLALITPGAGVVAVSVLVDLGTYNDVHSHRDDIRSLDLESIDVTITELKSDNAAKVLSGTLTMRKEYTDPPENDIRIGDLTAFQIQQNGTRRIAGNPQIDAFLLERVHDGGTFYLVLNGTTDAKTDIVMDVNLHASMGYDTGLF
jgi:hypothetical protein